ncbi:MAG TPA: hypothetical protein PK954_19080 [Anaerolineales bacterium]|nr:hypothetical protein [Anaerolineales bacterium]
MSISTGGKLVVAFFAVGLGAGVGVTDAAFAANQLPIALLLASGVLLGALNPRLAGRVSAHCLGLSDRAGTLPLYRPAQEPGAASLRPPGYANVHGRVVAPDDPAPCCGNHGRLCRAAAAPLRS